METIFKQVALPLHPPTAFSFAAQTQGHLDVMGIQEKKELTGRYCPKFNSPSCVCLPSDVQIVNMQNKT